jgi:hypothetical protein
MVKMPYNESMSRTLRSKKAPHLYCPAHSPAARAGRQFWTAGILAIVAGLILRLWFFRFLFNVDGDSLVYGDLAKNLLLHGRYAFTASGGGLDPTLIRLPGYPLFLALSFRLFGVENYFAAGCIQIVLDLATCLLIADFARRIAPAAFGRRAAMAALWLSALCPFTAAYVGIALTEAPTLFTVALAAWAVARFREKPRWPAAILFTFAATSATLLRPDGALAAAALAPALVLCLPSGTIAPRRLARMALVCVLLALAPFGIWTLRNWRVFHVFQPLAPRLANNPDELQTLGWERWVKTWSLDFVSTCDIYWNVPGDRLDISKLPARAFDSSGQFAATAALAEDYNRSGMQLTPALDARFAALARERTAAHPLRTNVGLPLGRVADMLLRPRVEDLPIDLDWWVWSHHHTETLFSWGYAALNALYFSLGFAGLWLRPRLWLAFAAYFVLRCALLASVAGPEARYTLEFFPFLCAFGGVALASAGRARRSLTL